MLAKKDQIEQN